MKLSQIRPAAGRCLRTVFERLTDWHVLTTLPRGVSLAHDITRGFPTVDVRVVLDVGANIGQSAEEYLDAFSMATIYAFEPVKATFEGLEKRFDSEDRVKCFRTALGAKRGRGEMALLGTNDQFTLREHCEARTVTDMATEEVTIETIDDFCEAHVIERVDLLKVDTEGHDLEVLRGAERMLQEQRVALIQTEVAMSPLNTLHVPLEHMKSHLEARGYYLFGLYEQVAECLPIRSPVLRRTNAVFVSDRATRANERSG